MELGVGMKSHEPLEDSSVSRLTDSSLQLAGPLEAWGLGIASLKHPDMPAYPPGTCTTSLSNFQGQNPWDSHSEAMRPEPNSVTAGGSHNAWRSKPWYMGEGNRCSCFPRAMGAGQGGKAHPVQPLPSQGRRGEGCRWDQRVLWGWFWWNKLDHLWES